MGFYNITTPVEDMTTEELCYTCSDRYFQWVDTDGKEGSSLDDIHQWCEDGDVGDEYDVYQKVLYYYDTPGYTREDLIGYITG